MATNYENFSGAVSFIEDYYTPSVNCSEETKQSIIDLLNNLPQSKQDDFKAIFISDNAISSQDLLVDRGENTQSIADMITITGNVNLGTVINDLSGREQANVVVIVTDTTTDQDITLKSKFAGAVVLGDGDDVLLSNSTTGTIVDTGNGNNQIQTSVGKDSVLSGLGDDSIKTSLGRDTVVITGGQDTVSLGNGRDLLVLCDEISGTDNTLFANGRLGTDTFDFSSFIITAPIEREMINDVNYFKIQYDHGTVYVKSFAEYIYQGESYTITELIGLINDIV